MSTDIIHTILSSLDYRQIDEPLHSALEHFKTVYANLSVPQFVLEVYDAVKMTDDLVAKRVLWLCLLTMMPSMQHYAVCNSSNQDRTTAFLGILAGEFEKLFSGSYTTHKYPLDVFVTNALIIYNS